MGQLEGKSIKPNRHFERTIRYLQKIHDDHADHETSQYHVMYWMEMDSVPVKEYWLDALLRTVLLGWQPPISRERVHYLYDRCVRVNSAKAKRELGWNPRSVERSWCPVMQRKTTASYPILIH